MLLDDFFNWGFLTEDEFRSILPAPQRWLDPENKEYKPGMGDFARGGRYLDMPSKEDVTGQTVARAFIDVSGEKPVFKASSKVIEPSQKGRGVRTIKTNLFKKSAGWKWVEREDDIREVQTLVSVEEGSKHHYTLKADFPNGVTLQRYENAPSEPRLRPTTHGQVVLGRVIGKISVRGREHPVYDVITIKRS